MYINKPQQIEFIAFIACSLLIVVSPGVFINDYFTFREHALCCIALILGIMFIFSKAPIFVIEYSHLIFVVGIIIMCISDRHNWGFYQLYWICCALLLISLCQRKINTLNFLYVLSLLCMYELILCVLQILKLLSANNGMITGSFDNPAGLCSFFTLCTPLLVVSFNRTRNNIILLLLLLILSTIIYAKARFAILTVSLLCLMYSINNKKKVYFLVTLLCFVALVILFINKSSSTIGRSFVLYITMQLLGNSILFFGKGQHFFTQKYMTQQAEYFEVHPDSIYAYLADNISHPLNEYFILYLSFGIVGILVLVFFLYYLWISWNG